MERKFEITDYGKDYGHGRYVIRSTDLLTYYGTNDFNEVILLTTYFKDNGNNKIVDEIDE
jgi:hypothetical protein